MLFQIQYLNRRSRSQDRQQPQHKRIARIINGSAPRPAHPTLLRNQTRTKKVRLQETVGLHVVQGPGPK